MRQPKLATLFSQQQVSRGSFLLSVAMNHCVHGCLHVHHGTYKLGVASADPKAPSDAIVNGTIAVSGTGTYDSGDVCAAESNAFIYVKSTCTDDATVGITVSITALQPMYNCRLCVFDFNCHNISCVNKRIAFA